MTAVAYSFDQSKECYELIDEALELLKSDPPVGDEKEVEQWASGMYVRKRRWTSVYCKASSKQQCKTT